MTREARISQNESFFRQVNERVRDVNEAFSILTEHGDFVCECGDPSCVERVRLTLDEYSGVRADPALFAVVPGHEIDDVEDVVSTNDRFFVVRKHEGEPASIARRLA